MQRTKDVPVRSRTVKKAILNRRLADRNRCDISSSVAWQNFMSA
jgi:hypothetical protein